MARRPGRLRRWLKRLGIGFALVVVIGAAPIVWNETQCVGSLQPRASTYTPVLQEPHRRNLVDTWLTYPEWSIVHAYEDLAKVSRARDESSFEYVDSVFGFWRNLCSLSALASSRGVITSDMKAMLYIIGLSFSAEMAVKGIYESTLGRLTEWIRGDVRTPEDEFAYAVADDYAEFLRQTPWYEFPFGATLSRFWSRTPFSGGNPVRKIERRFALSMEYGVKAIYAKVIAQAAALAPAALTMRSFISALDDAEAVASGVKVIERRADGPVIIETPRYRAFTAFMLAQIRKGRSFIEIAGNNEIFVTVLAPPGMKTDAALAQELFAADIQARPGWTRRGLSVPLAGLNGLLRELDAKGAEFEHAYDY